MSLSKISCLGIHFAMLTALSAPLHAGSKIPIGTDVCEVLIKRANAVREAQEKIVLDEANPQQAPTPQHQNPTSDLSENFTVGWSRGPSGTGDKLRERFRVLLQESKASGGTEEDAVIKYLQEHAFLKPEAIKEKIQPPKAITRSEALKNQEIINDVNVEKLMKEFAKTGDNKNSEDIKDLDIMNALDSIERGLALSSDDVTALGRLYTKVNELGTRADRLRSMLGAEGQADYVTWKYLKSNDAELRKKIVASDNDENLYISYPGIHEETKKPFIQVRKITDLEDYKVLYTDFERRGKKVKEYEDELNKYSWDYIKYRHLQTRLKTIQNAKIKFKVDDPSKPDVVITAETENREKFDAYKHGIIDGMVYNKAVHPTPEMLKSRSLWKSVSAKGYASDRVYRKFSGYAITFVLVPTNLYLFWQTRIKENIVASAVDQAYALDENYWINKCSAERSKKNVDECLRRWGEVARRSLRKTVEEKQRLDPSYTGIVELKLIKDMSQRIVMATFEKAGFEVMGALQNEYDLFWLPQKLYTNLEAEFKAIEKAAEDKKASLLPPPKDAGKETDKNAAPAKTSPIKQEVAQKALGSLRKDFIAKSAKLESDFSSLKETPRKQAMLLWEYSKELMVLSESLEPIEKLTFENDDFHVRASVLREQITAELEKIETKTLELIPANIHQ